MSYKLGLFGLSAVLLFAVAAANASACNCDGGWYGVGYGWGYNRLYRTDREIPYFAEFPPVYYSFPVPRTYGYSPYAYPRTVLTPDVELAPQPEEIRNPHVAPSPDAKPTPEANPTSDRSTSTRTRPEPLVIVNPFVTSSELIAESRE